MPITYQWRRDTTPIAGATNASYTAVVADVDALLDCEVTGTNAEGNAVVYVTTGRVITNNRLVGCYEWNYAWAANDAPTIPGDLPNYQGTIDATLADGLTYEDAQYTGRLVALDVGPARLNDALKPLIDGEYTASGLAAADATTVHVRVIMRAPRNPEQVAATLLERLEGTSGDSHVMSLGAATVTSEQRYTSETLGFASDVSLTTDLDTRNHWVVWDIVLSPTEHWFAINGVQYTGSAGFTGHAANPITATFLDGLKEADDTDFLFLGIRYGDFTFTEHENDYLSTALRLPFPAIQPTVLGSRTVGSLLSIDLGSWEGYAPLTYAYQWHSGGVDIGGATASTYTLTATEANTPVGVRITATNDNAESHTIDVYAGLVLEGSALELTWDHAWTALSGSRLRLIDDTPWDYAWDMSAAPGTPGTVPAYAGSRDLSLISGTYTTGLTPGLLTADAIGARTAITISTAHLQATDVHMPVENVHIQLIVERPSSSGTLFSWGDISVTYTHNVDPQQAFYSINTLDLTPDDADWIILDIVRGRNALTASANGVTASTAGIAPFIALPSTLDINGAGDYGAGVLFVGVRTLIADAFTSEDHRAAYTTSGQAAALDAHTWDFAWDFSTASGGNVSAFAGAFDLTLSSGTYSTGGATPYIMDAIGAGRVDDALLADNDPQFTVSDASLDIGTGYHLRMLAHVPTHTSDQTLFNSAGLTLTATSAGNLEVDFPGHGTLSGAYTAGWNYIDIYSTDDGNFVASVFVNGQTLDSVDQAGPTFTSLGTSWSVLSGFTGSILFLGVRQLAPRYLFERHEEAYRFAAGQSFARPFTPLVSGSVPLEGTGFVAHSQPTGDLNTATLDSLEDEAVYLNGSTYWEATLPELAGVAQRHYRLIMRPAWGLSPAFGRLLGAGSTADAGRLLVYNDDAGDLIIESGDNLTLTVPVTAGAWHLLDIVVRQDASEAVLCAMVNGAYYEDRFTGVHQPLSGYVGIGSYGGGAGFIGDFVFGGIRQDTLSLEDHYDLYRTSGLFQDLVAEHTWNYAWDFSQAPDTPGNAPALSGGVDLTLTGSYATGGLTGGYEADIIGASRVDDALIPTATTSFSATDPTFIIDTEFGVHLRCLLELYPTDPSADILTIGDTSTGSGIGIVRRPGGADQIRLVTRTTTGAANTFDVSTVGHTGWATLDIVIEPDDANTQLQVAINGYSATSTWAQAWAGLDQDALTLTLDNRPNILFLGIRTLQRNFLIDCYTWTHAWDWSRAPGTPGSVAPYAGSVTATLTGTYTTAAGTGGLNSAGISNARIDAAIAPAGYFTATDASIQTTGNIHFRALLRPRAPDNYLFHNSTTPWLARLSSAWEVSLSTAITESDTGIDTTDEQWVLVDVNMRSDGANGSIVDLMVNGQRNTITSATEAWAGFGSSTLELFADLASSAEVDGDYLFHGFRFGEQLPFAQHVRDYLSSGLTHLWTNIAWDNAWEFSQAPVSDGDVPAYAGAVALTATGSVDYDTGQSTAGFSDEAVGSAKDLATRPNTAVVQWDVTDAALAKTAYHLRFVAKHAPFGDLPSECLYDWGPSLGYTDDGTNNARQLTLTAPAGGGDVAWVAFGGTGGNLSIEPDGGITKSGGGTGWTNAIATAIPGPAATGDYIEGALAGTSFFIIAISDTAFTNWGGGPTAVTDNCDFGLRRDSGGMLLPYTMGTTGAQSGATSAGDIVRITRTATGYEYSINSVTIGGLAVTHAASNQIGIVIWNPGAGFQDLTLVSGGGGGGQTITLNADGQYVFDHVVTASDSLAFINGQSDASGSAGPATTTQLQVCAENNDLLFLGIRESHTLTTLQHTHMWEDARRRNIIDRYNWTHAWDLSAQNRSGADLIALAGGVNLTPPTNFAIGQSTAGLITAGIGASRQDKAAAGVASGAWTNLSASGLTTTEPVHIRAVYRFLNSGTVIDLGDATAGGRLHISPEASGRHRVRYETAAQSLESLPVTVYTTDAWILVDANVRESASGETVLEVFVNGTLVSTDTNAAMTYAGIANNDIELGRDFPQSLLFVGTRYGRQITLAEHQADANNT